MTDVIIIGAGVVSAAIAFELSRFNINVMILEKENDVSDATTKANSGIVHAGYDPKPGTLMARLNVAGSKQMKELCEKLSVPYNMCGSLVLAFDDEEVKTVEKLYDRGVINGVEKLSILSSEQVLELEPNVSKAVKSALYAPTGAVISPWELAIALLETAVKNGVIINLNSTVTGIKKEQDFFLVTVNGDKSNKKEYKSKYVVNCAGVHSDNIHNMIDEKIFEITADRGEYYLLDKSMSGTVNSVIFQAPTKVGKGVLVAPTAHGNIIVGPTNESVTDKDDCSTTSQKLDNIRLLSQKSVPSIGQGFRENIRNFAGIRANSNEEDFYIKESENVKGFIDVACIKSPGLSAAPAIGQYVADMIVGKQDFTKKLDFIDTREHIVFKKLSNEEKNKLIQKDSDFGQVICRCETITKGEIINALNSPIPPVSVEGVKRRCDAGMGRCQGGFCSPRIVEIIAQHYNIDKTKVLLDRNGSNILVGKTKSSGGDNNDKR